MTPPSCGRASDSHPESPRVLRSLRSSTAMNAAIPPDVITRYEHDTWSRCAESYLTGFAALTRETVPLLLEAAHIRGGSNLLEIGSGPGHVAQALTEAGAKVTGVDFSARMV